MIFHDAQITSPPPKKNVTSKYNQYDITPPTSSYAHILIYLYIQTLIKIVYM